MGIKYKKNKLLTVGAGSIVGSGVAPIAGSGVAPIVRAGVGFIVGHEAAIKAEGFDR